MNPIDLFWFGVNWIAKDIATPSAFCAAAAFVLTFLVNVARGLTTQFDDILRCFPAASIPSGVLLIGLAFDPSRLDCTLLLTVPGIRVPIAIAGFVVWYVSCTGVFRPRR